jgi:hypothetical protein
MACANYRTLPLTENDIEFVNAPRGMSRYGHFSAIDETLPYRVLMGEKRERKRARRQAQLRGETYSPAVVKMIAGTPPDDLGGFFDGQTGVREPRPPSPKAPEVGDALEPPAEDPPAQ